MRGADEAERHRVTGPVGDGVTAFESFARRERAALVALAWSLTGRMGVAEEIVQETLTAAWRSWGDVGRYDRPGAWARRVVANRASTFWRSAGRERRAFARLGGPGRIAELELPEGDVGLWDAVRALPERQSHVVALYYVEDQSVAAIAEILECAEGTVKAHLHKARLSLARVLGAARRSPDEEDDQ